MRNAVAVASVLLLTACLPASDDGIDAEGTYDVRGTWAVGAPLADGRTPGEMAAELLVEEAVALAPIPGTLEDEAYDALYDAIGGWVAGRVDDNLPPELEEGGVVRAALESTLAQVDVESTLVLGGNLRGTETITAISITRDGVRHDLLPYQLARNGALAIEWNGNRRSEDEVSLADHQLEVQYVALIRFAVDVLAGGGRFDAIVTEAENAVPCAELATNPVEISVGGQKYTIETNILEQACEFARGEMLDRVLGRWDLALVTTGGSVRAFDEDADGRADRLVSEEGFGGTLEIPYVPNAVSPVLLMSFEATRRP